MYDEMIFRYSAVFCFWFLFPVKQAFTQSTAEDSSLRQAAYQHTVSIYDNQLGDQSLLYNGSRYEKYPYNFRLGTAYYPYDRFAVGSVTYDNIQFDSVPLLFDELQQVLVLNKDGYELQLISERISTFTIEGHVFLRLAADSIHAGIPVTRFYELIYPGPSQVLRATSKSIREEAFNADEIPRYMVTQEDYFIRQGNLYLQVKSVGRISELFTSHKNEIRQFVDSNNLNSDDKVNALIRVAGYYDKIAK